MSNNSTRLDLGKIIGVEEVYDLVVNFNSKLQGDNGRLGLNQMLRALGGYDNMDGYKVSTDKHIIYVLISNGQNCCESWGYFSSDDEIERFIGSELISIDLTDKALNNIKLEESGYYDDCGGIQFVDFNTTNGKFQLAIYNAHNGYYGHGIIVAIDDDIICDDTL